MQYPYEIDFISSIVENNKIRVEKRKFDNSLALLFNQTLNLSINSYTEATTTTTTTTKTTKTTKTTRTKNFKKSKKNNPNNKRKRDKGASPF